MTDYRNRIVELRTMKASELAENPLNWRRHPAKQRGAMETVLRDVGWVDTALYNQRTNRLIDGHLRRDVAGDAEIPVLVVDLSEDEERKVLATLDPIAALAGYSPEAFQALTVDMDLDLGGFFSDEDFAELFPVEPSEPPADAGAQMDRAESLRETYGVERGQVWEIGRHRLMCGDSYSQDHITILLDGTKPDMLHTDPPYGINIVKPRKNADRATDGGAKPFGSTAPVARTSNGKGSILDKGVRGAIGPANIVQSNLYPIIEGDDRPFDPAPLLGFAPIVILWGANYYADKLPLSSGWICWDKRENITRNNFADGELAWTNQQVPMRIFYHLWNGLHKGSQHGERRTHPTEKPVALFEEIGKLYCAEGIWCDLFAGTGAQLVAAERSGATCLAMEFEPLYVATTLQRLTDLGLHPRRVQGLHS